MIQKRYIRNGNGTRIYFSEKKCLCLNNFILSFRIYVVFICTFTFMLVLVMFKDLVQLIRIRTLKNRIPIAF